MQAASFSPKKIHVLRIDPNESVLETIEAWVKESGVTQAVVLGGYGTLASHHLHWVAHNRLPSANQYGKAEMGIEILAMNGIIADGEPHIHISLSTPEGAYGGHLEPGCRTYVLCEVMLAEIDGPKLAHRMVDADVPGMGKGKVSQLQFAD